MFDTKPRSPYWLLAALFGLLAGTAVPASGQQSPVDVIRSRNQAVQRILEVTGDSVTGPRREELKDQINGLIDFNELSRRALGRYWDQRSDQEKAAFVDVFRQLVRNSSVRKLGVHQADSMVYRPAVINGEQATVTTLAFKNRKSAEIVYYMHRVGGQWKAWDVVIDGSSTMRTYRDSFSREIASSSYEAMFARLKERLQEEPGI